MIRSKSIIGYIIAIIILIIIYVWRLFIIQRPLPNDELTIIGIVQNAPQKRGGVWQFQINNINIETAKPTNLQIGNLLKITGKTEQRVINPLYKENWLLTKDIITLQKYTEISIKKRIINHPFFEVTYQLGCLQNYFTLQFQRLLSPATAGLLSGMVLGNKEALSYNLYEIMKNSGLAHLVVASGSNIVLFAAVVTESLKHFLSKKKTLIFSYLAVVSYMLLAGMDPPVIRAGVMIGVLWLGQSLGRKTSGIWTLLISCLILLIIDPSLLFSVSFQLSVTATAGLIQYGSYLEGVLQKITHNIQLIQPFVSALSQTLAAQVFVLPILLHYFEKTNLLSIPANMLVGVVVTPVVIVGMGLLVLNALFKPIALCLAMFLDIILRFVLGVGSWAAKINIFQYNFSFSWLAVGVWYAFFIVLSLKLSMKQKDI